MIFLDASMACAIFLRGQNNKVDIGFTGAAFVLCSKKFNRVLLN